MSNEINVPEIRFIGFSEGWLHKTIDDLINEDVIYPPKDGNHGGIHPKATDYVEYGIPFIMANNIRGGEIQYGGCHHISLNQAENLQKGFAKTGDVLLTHKGTVGEVAIIGRIDFPYLMLTPQVTYYRVCDTAKLDTYFLATAFRSNKFQKPLKEEAGGGTRAYIGITAQKGLELTIPQEIEEQKELGNYFQKLDTLINQHQQKHHKLSNLKKAMLEKMFPKAGETVPEIRFEGFSGDWEQVPLIESFSFLSSNTLSRAELNYEQGKARNIHYGDILVKFGDVVDAQGADIPFISSDELVTKMSATKLQDGDVLFADAAEDETVGKCVEVTNVGEETVFSGLHTIATRPNQLFATNYLGYYLNSGAFHQQLVPLMQGTKVLSISKRAISTVDVKYPSDRREQEEIGKYFHQLDVLINQHNQQITKLKNIKQACLDKMFV